MPRVLYNNFDSIDYTNSYMTIYMMDETIEIIISFNDNNIILPLDYNLKFYNKKIPLHLITEINIICCYYKEEYNKILLDLLCVPYLKNVDIKCSNNEIYNKIIFLIPNRVNYNYFIKYI
jgi:hypothetical protein